MWSCGRAVGLLWKYEYNADRSMPLWIFNISTFIDFYRTRLNFFSSVMLRTSSDKSFHNDAPLKWVVFLPIFCNILLIVMFSLFRKL